MISKHSPSNETEDGREACAETDEDDLRSIDNAETVEEDSSASRNSVPWEMSVQMNNR